MTFIKKTSENKEPFIEHIKYKKNGLNEVTIMKNTKAYNKYFVDEENLENKLALGKENCKAELRQFFNENLDKISNSSINIIYLTDEGLHYIRPTRTPLELTRDYVSAVLMADPLTKRGPSGEDNPSSLIGKTVYGVQIYWMKSPKVVAQKQKEPEKKRKAPTFKPVIW